MAVAPPSPRPHAYADADPHGEEPAAGVIEQARHRRRARRTRLVLSCALLGGALIWLIIAAASGGTRAPRQLRLPPEAPHPVRLRGGALLVRLTPNLEGSMAGWCVDVETRGGSRGTCDPLPTRAHPFMEGRHGLVARRAAPRPRWS